MNYQEICVQLYEMHLILINKRGLKNESNKEFPVSHSWEVGAGRVGGGGRGERFKTNEAKKNVIRKFDFKFLVSCLSDINKYSDFDTWANIYIYHYPLLHSLLDK